MDIYTKHQRYRMNADNTKKLPAIMLKFLSGLFLAIVFGFALGFAVNALSRVGVFLDFGGDKSNVFIPLFFGVPLGSVLGFVMIDKKIGKKTKINWSGIVLGIISCAFLGVIGSTVLLDLIGGTAIFFIPIMMVLLALVGYQATYKYK